MPHDDLLIVYNRNNITVFKETDLAAVVLSDSVDEVSPEVKLARFAVQVGDHIIMVGYGPGTDDADTRQYGDRFFGEGLVAHVGFSDPVCAEVAGVVYQAASSVGVNVKKGGTYVCMEGPAFSTKAESELYRSWGMDVVGMTNLQEAKLAREAEICYATVAMVTDSRRRS